MSHDWTPVYITGAVPEFKTIKSMACSGDGQVIMVALEEGRLYLSTDRGDTWTEKQPAGDVDQYWRGLAVDDDGSVLLATARGGRIWLSTNGGTTWTEPRPKGDTYGLWESCAIDSDGSVIIVGENDGRLYVSTDGGTSWTERQPAGAADKSWYACAADDDGSVLVAAVYNGRLYMSTDFGANWTEKQPAGAADKLWACCACDSDGSVILAGVNWAPLYYSTNTGGSWTGVNDISTSWGDVMMNADGSTMLAVPGGGDPVQISTNGGSTWAGMVPVDEGTYPYWACGCCDSDASVVVVGGINWAISRNRLYLGLTGCPVLEYVNPSEPGGAVAGLTPNLTFGISNADAAAVHLNLKVSDDPAFGSYDINTNSATDYANWQVAASPYETWTTMTSGGAAAGNRARYPVTSALRYDVYFVQLQLDDGTHKSGLYRFEFTVVSESDKPLTVIIGGTTYAVISCRITEETGGESSVIDLEIPLSRYTAAPVAKGAAIAVSTSMGGGRTWNGTVETRRFNGSVVGLHGLQDDAYLSRKVATGNLASADLGANLIELVETYGAPLTAFNVNAYTGVNGAITGGYKYLREHLGDIGKQLPDYIYWVDETGDLHAVDQAELPTSALTIIEEDPASL